MGVCKHPNSPDCSDRDCVCYMRSRTVEHETLFWDIIAKKVDPPKGRLQDRDFRNYVFLEEAHFGNAVFRGDVDFRRTTFTKFVQFIGARFEGRADFFETTFMGEVQFQKTVFMEYTDFQCVMFKGDAMFSDSVFGGPLGFRHITFGKDASFVSATFEKGVCFWHTTFSGEACFSDATTRGVVRLLEISTILGKATSLYRLAKQAHQASGDFAKAGDCHYMERLHSWCERSGLDEKYLKRWSLYFLYRQLRKRVPDLTAIEGFVEERSLHRMRRTCRPKNWYKAFRLLLSNMSRAKNKGEFVFGNVVFGYGERLKRPAYTALALIILCAFIFLFAGIEQDGLKINRDFWPSTDVWGTFKDFGDSLYFSVVTFATLGYGDLRPFGLVAKTVANLESLAGLVLVAAFAVCLAKRYTRG